MARFGGVPVRWRLQSHLRVSTAGCLDRADMLALAKAGRLRAVLGSDTDLAAADTCQDV